MPHPIYIVHTFAALAVLATLLPLVRRDAWWIRAFEFPRLQILVLAGVVLLLELVFRRRKRWADRIMVLSLVAAIGLQSYRIFPFTRLAPLQAETATPREGRLTLEVMTANVLMTNRRADDYLALVREQRPDLLLTVEADAWWDRQLQPLEDDFPHVTRIPRDNTYGMILHARLPPIDSQVRYLVEDDVPSVHADFRLPDGRVLAFFGLHPRPPAPQEALDTTERDAELLLVAAIVAESDSPTVVAGDLNDVAWSYTTRLFQRVSGLLDPRIGRGFYNTFSTEHFWMRFPLDHVFHSDHFKVVRMERLESFGSDHFPIVLELAYDPLFQREQPEPDAQPGDLETAREKIEAGLTEAAEPPR